MKDVDVHRAEIDGVTTFWVDKDVDGPLNAALLFRVGKADETLVLNGVTHLLEHVVLHGVDLAEDEGHRNGSVTTTLTSFTVSGTEPEVCRFLAGVCAGLVDPPVEFVENERRVLEAEAARTSSGVVSQLLRNRFGPAGPGLWSCAEFGSANATTDVLRAWAAAHFTSGNAILVLDGPIPEGLRLELPPGPLAPVPPLTDVLYATPLWFRHEFSEVAAHTVLPRGPAEVAWSSIARTRLVSRLRADHGIAYSPEVSYDPYDADSAQVSIVADAHPDHLAEAATILYGVIDDLATSGPTQDELDAYVAQARRATDGPQPAMAAAYRVAHDELHSRRTASIADLRREIDGLTTDQIRTAAGLARDRLFYALPADVKLPNDQVAELPSWSLHPPIDGVFYRPATREPLVIAINQEGISYRGQDNDYVAVPFESCRGVLSWPDGRRVLVSDEGLTLTVEPTLWTGGRGLVGLIDQSTAHLQIPMPARAPDEIPRIPETKSEKQPLAAGHRAIWTGFVIMGLAAMNGVPKSPTGSIAPFTYVAVAVGAIVTGIGLLARWVAKRAQRQASVD